MAATDTQAVAMEDQEQEQEQEQTLDDAKNPCQQDSAYGSLESSSQGISQKSSYSGSKSLNSGSSRSSGFGDNADFSENRLKDTKHKDHKRKKTKEKVEKGEMKEMKMMMMMKEEKEMTRPDPRLASETASSIATGLEESSSAFNSQCHDADERTDQPNLVYTQALNYIRKIKERSAEQGVPFASPELALLPRDTHDIPAFPKSFKSTRGFTVAISVQDGLVLQVSPAITEVLGFPKDMLVGQSFIDFVYPKDSINLSSKIIHGLHMPFRSESIKDHYGTSFFCRMRVYHSLRSSGFGVRNRRRLYKPCKMLLKFHEPSAALDDTTNTNTTTANTSSSSSSSLLLAEVIPIQSVYQVPEEEASSLGSFSIRHTASCNFSEYDPEAIPFLGHLPQDLTGNSVFECYHPEDLPLLRDAYHHMVREQGRPHRSKPYRFRTFNGSYVTLDTEWLCFVNPWTKRIDSIIGQHRVLKGPSDIAIFLDPGDKAPTPLPEEVMKEAQRAQRDILELLAKPVVAYKDPSKGSQEMRRRTLANMMSSIVDELDSLEKTETQAPLPQQPAALPALHHPKTAEKPRPPLRPDHASSLVQKGQESVTSSSESPSSYGHLNYSETIHRFFRSQPKTVSSDESGDSKMEVSHLGSLGSTTNKQSQDNSQSQSGSGSGDNCDHTRKSETTTTTAAITTTTTTTGRASTTGRSYKHVQLTEEVLSRHNADMQKMFMQRQRTGHKQTHKDKAKLRKPIGRLGERVLTCGVKRGGAALDHEASASKQPFLAPSAAGSSSSLKPSTVDVWGQGESQTHTHTHIHSSGSAGVTMGPGTTHVAAPSYPGIVPSFYFPTSTSSISQVAPVPRAPAPLPLVLPPQQPTFLHPQGVTAVPLQYIPGVMYQPVCPPLFNAAPLMLPNMVYQHTAIHAPPLTPTQLTPAHTPITPPMPMSDGEKPSGADSDHDLFEPIPQSATSFLAKRSTSHPRRPDSQATSVKAQPGSVRGSTTSASGKVVGSYSHLAESIRSYVEDTTTVSPGCTPKVSRYSQSTSVRAEAETIASPHKQDKMVMEPPHENSSDMVLSVTSSMDSPAEYKSSDESLQNVSDHSENSELSGLGMKWNIPRAKCQRPVLSDPPWLEEVKLTPTLLYKYQLETKDLVDVLRQDMDKLKNVRQPTMVDDQLSSLYNELELEGLSPYLYLEDGVTSSSSGDDEAGTSEQETPARSSSYFSKMAMVHEEDAPVPPSDIWCCHRQHAQETSSSSS